MEEKLFMGWERTHKKEIIKFTGKSMSVIQAERFLTKNGFAKEWIFGGYKYTNGKIDFFFLFEYSNQVLDRKKKPLSVKQIVKKVLGINDDAVEAAIIDFKREDAKIKRF